MPESGSASPHPSSTFVVGGSPPLSFLIEKDSFVAIFFSTWGANSHRASTQIPQKRYTPDVFTEYHQQPRSRHSTVRDVNRNGLWVCGVAEICARRQQHGMLQARSSGQNMVKGWGLWADTSRFRGRGGSPGRAKEGPATWHQGPAGLRHIR